MIISQAKLSCDIITLYLGSMMYKVGQVIEGYISGIQPYGAFVYIDEQTSGLIHISELSDGFVHDISQYVQIGDKVYS